ncbi:MAG TPA: DUF1295 domain-containing protein [Candidatus Eisenbacteria bacterium]|nr:DUF1295 domain-containing protein [Candidatus Eisenbacteria bacterium]
MILPLMALGFLGAAFLMLLLWLVGLRSKNAGWVDFGWAAALVLLAVWAAVTGAGWKPRRLAVAFMAAVWGGRLASMILGRLLRDGREDPRYRKIREEWKQDTELRFFLFFQLQALVAAVLALPYFLASANPRAVFAPVEWAGVFLWAAGFAGEALADRQLADFKRDPANRGKVCERGLWNHSRHPNYFFEALQWVAWSVFALGSPHGWTAVICPAMMLHFLLNVSGVPPAEAQSLASRGDAFRRYQKTTSVFVPWFKRSAA